MIRLKPALTEDEVKKTGVAQIRQAYNNLAKDYNRLIDGKLYYCHKCNEFHAVDAFYSDKRYASGLFPICKKCLIGMACDYDKKTNQYTDNREKTMDVLKMMDLPYIDSMYQSALTSCAEDVQDKHRNTAWSHYITVIKSLPNWRGLTWKDSELPADYLDEDEEEINENSRILKQAKKRFGDGYTNADLLFLESEYQDWIKRYACENKAQEILFKRICFKELEIDKAQKAKRDTKELDKTLQDLMGSMSLKPNQNNSNALTEAKTFGQLIQKWEDEKPIPEPEDEFKDVDKIGLYIDVFFKGHLSKMMGLKNAFTPLYDRFMKKYTVKKPQYNEDDDTEVLFDQIFGPKIEDE